MVENKAANWNFDSSKITEKDMELILRILHGDSWFESARKEDIYIDSFYFFLELNALFANKLIKLELNKFEDGIGREFVENIFCSHKKLKLSDEFIAFYFCKGADESETYFFENDINEAVQVILGKYNFW